MTRLTLARVEDISPEQIQDIAHELALSYFWRHRTTIFSRPESTDGIGYDVALLAIGMAGSFGSSVEKKRAMPFAKQMHATHRGQRGLWAAYQRARAAGEVTRTTSIPVWRDADCRLLPLTLGTVVVDLDLAPMRVHRDPPQSLPGFEGVPDDALVIVVTVRPADLGFAASMGRMAQYLCQLDVPWDPKMDHADQLIPAILGVLQAVQDGRITPEPVESAPPSAPSETTP